MQWGKLGRPGPVKLSDITVPEKGKPFDERFNITQGDAIRVWQDPGTQEIFLVNGARRIATATRDEFGTIQAEFVNAKTLDEARLFDDLLGRIDQEGADQSLNDVVRGLLGREPDSMEVLQLSQGKLPPALEARLKAGDTDELIEAAPTPETVYCLLYTSPSPRDS